MFENQDLIKEYLFRRLQKKNKIWNLAALGLLEHLEIQSSELYLRTEFTYLSTRVLRVRFLLYPKNNLSLADWLRVTGNYETFYMNSWKE